MLTYTFFGGLQVFACYNGQSRPALRSVLDKLLRTTVIPRRGWLPSLVGGSIHHRTKAMFRIEGNGQIWPLKPLLASVSAISRSKSASIHIASTSWMTHRIELRLHTHFGHKCIGNLLTILRRQQIEGSCVTNVRRVEFKS